MTQPATLTELQRQVAAFVADNELETGIEYRTLDLVSEIGELAKELLKISNYGRHPAGTSMKWPIELADTLFALICLANTTGVDLDTALAAALDKYKARLAVKGDAGSGA